MTSEPKALIATGIFALSLVIVVILATYGTSITGGSNYQCITTAEDARGPFGGRFFEVSCTNGIKFSQVGEILPDGCGVRIGDSVTVTTHFLFFETVITKDDACS